MADARARYHVVDHPARALVASPGHIARCDDLGFQKPEDMGLLIQLSGLTVPVTDNDVLDLEGANVANDLLQLAEVVGPESSCMGLEVDGDEGDISASEPDGGCCPLFASLPILVAGP